MFESKVIDLVKISIQCGYALTLELIESVETFVRKKRQKNKFWF